MGVKGLWTCLDQIAQRIDLKYLRGKVIAIDMMNLLHRYEFMETMNSEDNIPLNHCHVQGLLNTICILLSFGIKPIFVFDGRPSELKRSTIERRRSERPKDNQEHDGERDMERHQENGHEKRRKDLNREKRERQSRDYSKKSFSAQSSNNKATHDHHKNSQKPYVPSESMEDSSKFQKKSSKSYSSLGADFFLKDTPLLKQGRNGKKKKVRLDEVQLQSSSRHSDIPKATLRNSVENMNSKKELMIGKDSIKTLENSEIGSAPTHSDQPCKAELSVSSKSEKKNLNPISREYDDDENFNVEPRKLLRIERNLAKDEAKKREFKWARENFVNYSLKSSKSLVPDHPASPIEQEQDELYVHFTASGTKDPNIRTQKIDQQVIEDTIRLIKCFKLPFLVSPGEAEAQCAMLEEIGFTQGTLTEDSDIWLFGGRTVYRTFSNSRREVNRYLASDIESKLNLKQQDLVCIGMLCGCDYTAGIRRVRFEEARHILHQFEGEGFEKLKNFKKWSSMKESDDEKLRSICKLNDPEKIRMLRELKLPEEFPRKDIYNEFMEPRVQTTFEPFEWRKLNKKSLKQLLNQRSDMSSKEIYSTMKMVKDILQGKNVNDILPDSFLDLCSLND